MNAIVTGPRTAGAATVDPPEQQVETLVEFASSRGERPRVCSKRGVIEGVKILGLRSRNGRSYRSGAVAAAAALYEGVRVNVNHPPGGGSGPRDYRDRLGCLRNVRSREGGLYGDLHFNPRHALAEQLAWDAEFAPENVGLSHNVQARTSRSAGQVVVEEILKVNSVDLVADPATTSGLFESRRESAEDSAADGAGADGAPASRAGIKSLVRACLEEEQAKLKELRAELDALAAQAAAARKRERIDRLMEQHGLPRGAAGARFREQLEAVDEKTAEQLIEERSRQWAAASPTGGRPQSKGAEPGGERATDVAAWARTIT